eukprot:Phypoly_transcript_17788.p1 GENE.Phypoly_transcript_17788~~Phypoly_transcript_17788.p1  ORF type:complete len:145 (+),score=10.01 Phypoly_transcript_17788:105-539(+)
MISKIFILSVYLTILFCGFAKAEHFADLTECTKCNTFATCNYTGEAYLCVCKKGFSGDGYNCEDINECEVVIPPCDKNATCINTIGTFKCVCSDGFHGNGFTCKEARLTHKERGYVIAGVVIGIAAVSYLDIFFFFFFKYFSKN